MDQAFCQYLSLRRIAHCQLSLSRCHAMPLEDAGTRTHHGDAGTGPSHGDARTGDADTGVIEVETWTEAGESDASVPVSSG